VIISRIRTRERSVLSLRTSNWYSWEYLTQLFDVTNKTMTVIDYHLHE